uniref:Xylosyltransferase 1 n=2 Tax=Aegilops tauschii subsp. strangulata TaxID=200361 RepID=A0A453RZA3_AEGTS
MRKSCGLNSGPGRPFNDRRWLLPFLASLLVSVTLFLAAACGLFSPPYLAGDDAFLVDVVSFTDWDDGGAPSQRDSGQSVEPEAKDQLLDDNDNPDNAAVNSDDSDAEPPRLAYLLEGTKGDGLRMRRVLQAIYHPRNQYILHLDLEAPPRERIDLAMYVKGDPMFSQVGNVRVIAKGNLVTYKGPTMVACTLHAVAILLKEGLEWDWFINLSASDYPLMTQDDILHVFSSLPRNLNFIEHMQISGWKRIQRAKPIVLDPGLYLLKKFDLSTTPERRELPTSFKLYTGRTAF